MPVVLTAPYGSDGELLWVIAPLVNESGVSQVDELSLTDQLAYQVTQVNGLAALPLNRTIEAMRVLGIGRIDTPEKARAVARTLGADAIVVGSITAWDPYDPPTLGLNLTLLPTSGAMLAPGFADPDPRAMQGATTDTEGPSSGPRQASAVAEHLDASSHEVQALIQRYASGRTEDQSALAWRGYTKSMKLFQEFACFRTVERLLDAESRRVASANSQQTVSAR